MTYQWQKNSANLSNGGHYSGATTATLTASTCDSTDAASYRCVITNGAGSATSAAAALTIATATTITQQPANRTVASGGTTTFTIAATGQAPLTYQWQKNSVNLVNGGHYSGVAALSTLTVSSADNTDVGNYGCRVTGGCGILPSNAATLTISGTGTSASSISQYGITWTFDKAYPVGQFVNGDWWVKGPVVVASVSPAPIFGANNTDQLARNGSCINPIANSPTQPYDGRYYSSSGNNYSSAPPSTSRRRWRPAVRWYRRSAASTTTGTSPI